MINNEKVASLWADKNVTINTESSFNGLMCIHFEQDVISKYG